MMSECGPRLPGGETYDVSGTEKFIKKLKSSPKLAAQVEAMAKGRAKDIFESGDLEKEFKKGDRVLYIGVGTGNVPKYIKEQTGVEPFGIDIANLHTPANKGDKKFAIANARQLPFADGAFDTICAFDMLHHTKGQEEILKEVKRVLKPGGKCLILEDTTPEPYMGSEGAMKKIVGFVDDLFNKQPKGVNPHNYHSISDWELMFSELGMDFNTDDVKSWYWGVMDFLPENLRPARPDKRTLGRPFESTLFKVSKSADKKEE